MSIKQSTQILGNSLFLLHIPSWIDWACQNAFWDSFLRQLQFQCWECGYLRSELPYWMDNMPAFPRRFIDLYTRPFIQSLSERVIAAEDMLRGWLKVPCDEKRFMTDIDISARLEWLNSVGLYYELPDWESELKAGLEASRVALVSPPANALGSSSDKWMPIQRYPKRFHKDADEVCNLCATHRNKRNCNLFVWADQLCWT